MFRELRAHSLVLTVFGLASGCTTVENEPVTDPSTKLSEAAFKCNVEPVLIKQCSYNACHGNPGTALRVYSVGKLRATPPADVTAATAALTAEEEHANFTSAAGFAASVTDPADNWLLLKPLPQPLGGYRHLGGAIWSGTNDPQFGAIYAWLKGGTTCN